MIVKLHRLIVYSPKHNSNRYDIIASYRVKFAFVDELAEMIEHAAVQGGGPPVLDRAG